MKLKLLKIAAVFGLLCSSASATTVVLGGGTTGFQFVTSEGAVLPNTLVTVGTFTGGTFSAFEGTGTPQIGLGAVSTFAGRWNNQIANTGAAANPFNGADIYVAIQNQGGVTYVTSSAWSFPTNAGGVGDSITILASEIDGYEESLSTVPWVSTGGGQVVLGVVPEPSVALLGALGVLGLIRRRR